MYDMIFYFIFFFFLSLGLLQYWFESDKKFFPLFEVHLILRFCVQVLICVFYWMSLLLSKEKTTQSYKFSLTSLYCDTGTALRYLIIVITLGHILITLFDTTDDSSFLNMHTHWICLCNCVYKDSLSSYSLKILSEEQFICFVDEMQS